MFLSRVACRIRFVLLYLFKYFLIPCWTYFWPPRPDPEILLPVVSTPNLKRQADNRPTFPFPAYTKDSWHMNAFQECQQRLRHSIRSQRLKFSGTPERCCTPLLPFHAIPTPSIYEEDILPDSLVNYPPRTTRKVNECANSISSLASTPTLIFDTPLSTSTTFASDPFAYYGDSYYSSQDVTLPDKDTRGYNAFNISLFPEDAKPCGSNRSSYIFRDSIGDKFSKHSTHLFCGCKTRRCSNCLSFASFPRQSMSTVLDIKRCSTSTTTSSVLPKNLQRRHSLGSNYFLDMHTAAKTGINEVGSDNLLIEGLDLVCSLSKVTGWRRDSLLLEPRLCTSGTARESIWPVQGSSATTSSITPHNPFKHSILGIDSGFLDTSTTTQMDIRRSRIHRVISGLNQLRCLRELVSLLDQSMAETESQQSSPFPLPSESWPELDWEDVDPGWSLEVAAPQASAM